VNELRTNPDIASRTEQIMHLRKKEIDEVKIQVQDGKVDLRPLWLTAYGFEILSVMGMGLRTDIDGLERIKEKFIELGTELTMTTDSNSKYTVDMSEDFREYIWALARRNEIIGMKG
jgi:hypothetical protein